MTAARAANPAAAGADGAPRDLSPEVTQRKASNPGASVWVNASAGSGKTRVLTNRVLRLLLGNVAPQKILCLTYTRAAAAEMSIRIMQRLSHWAVCSDDELRHELDDLQGAAPKARQLSDARRLFAQVLACPGGMRIRTIHAFCQEILRRFPVEAGLPPHFTVIEETEADNLFQASQRDVLRRAAADPHTELGQALATVVNEIGSFAFQQAMRQCLLDRGRMQQALRQAGGVAALTKNLRDVFHLRADDSVDTLMQGAATLDQALHAELRRIGELLLQGKKTDSERGQKITYWLSLGLTERITEFDIYCECFFTKEFAIRAALATKDLIKKFPDIEAVMQREALRLQMLRERLEILRLVETTQAVVICAAQILEGYQTRKRQRGVLDYDDLIIQTTNLLQRAGIAPWVLYKLDGGLDHILVDEAQDTSQAQWDIIAALAQEFFSGRGARDENHRTLFVVGDEKQSIFSFQRADPAAFLAMRRYFAQHITDAGKTYQEVPLQISFRSAPAILQAVDAVFAAELARNGVAAEPVKHWPFKRAKAGRVEVWPLQPAATTEKSDGPWQVPRAYEEERDPQAHLADTIAATIRDWLTRRESLPGANRPMAAGDIMILLRRRGRFADLMVRALKKRGVPVTGVDRMHLIKQLPVMDLLALLQFFLLPEDDLTLASILRGPFIGLSEEQLMQVAIGRAGSLWQALRDAADQDSAFQSAVSYLTNWLNRADFITPFAMLADILNTPCPGDARSGRRALAKRLGADALDPVDELLNAAQSYSIAHAPSLQCFLQWLMATDSEIKRELDQGAGQVRIMTVHASKGLEAPVVFLPDTVAQPQARKGGQLLWQEGGEIAVPIYAARKPTMGLPLQLWEEAQQKQMQEYRRLLYVALTRAESRLYIAGWETTRRESDDPGNWYNLVKNALQPLHDPAAPAADGPMPDIIVADPVLRAEAAPALPKAERPTIALPAWALTPAAMETENLPALVPSQGGMAAQPATATPDEAFTRGRIIHRLLQSLPDVPAAQRDAAAGNFLANPQLALSTAQQDAIRDEVLALLNHPDYAPLFGVDSRAEIPLSGMIDGRAVSGQVDRLCLRGNEVWIVDYKTNRPPPHRVEDVPDIYIQQMAAYRAILAAIYPQRTIRCFLLWTYAPLLMELPQNMVSGGT